MSLLQKSHSVWGDAVIVCYPLFTTLAAIAVVLRLWARRIKKCALSLNDWAVVVAVVLCVGLTVLALTGIVYGGQTKHLKDATLKELRTLLQLLVAGQIVWASANTAVKISILHLYIQIFRNKVFRVFSYAIMGLSMAYWLMVVLEAFVVCRPFAYSWNKAIPGGTCHHQQDVFLSAGIMNLIIDVMIIVLPMPMLWGLQMRLAKKVALTGIFGLGAFICVITALRIITLAELNFLDITYSITPMALWTGLEPTLGVINACLPVIQPVVQTVLNSSLFSRSASGSRSSKTSKLWSLSNSSKARRRKDLSGGGGDEGTFHRVDDPSYPLTENVGTLTHISGPQNRSVSTVGDLEAQREEGPPPPQQPQTVRSSLKNVGTAINVRKDWEVRSGPNPAASSSSPR